MLAVLRQTSCLSFLVSFFSPDNFQLLTEAIPLAKYVCLRPMVYTISERECFFLVSYVEERPWWPIQSPNKGRKKKAKC